MEKQDDDEQHHVSDLVCWVANLGSDYDSERQNSKHTAGRDECRMLGTFRLYGDAVRTEGLTLELRRQQRRHERIKMQKTDPPLLVASNDRLGVW